MGTSGSGRDRVVEGLTAEHEDLGLVVMMLTRLDEYRRRGLAVEEIAQLLADEFEEAPGGGRWDAPTVDRVLAIVDDADVGPTPIELGPQATGAANPRSSGPARLGLTAVVFAAIGAIVYGAFAAAGNRDDSAGPETTTPVETTNPEIDEEQNPVDMMAIRIEPPAAVASSSGLSPATATIRTDGLLHLEGAFRSRLQAESYIADAAEVFGRENIVESYVIDSSAPEASVSDVSLDKPVLFESGTATIDPSFIPFLEACGDVLRLNPHITMSVTAFTDSVGDEKFNLELSQRRAKAILDFYRDLAIDDSQLVGKGFGEADPVAGNDTDEGRHENRRAILELLNVVENEPNIDGN